MKKLLPLFFFLGGTLFAETTLAPAAEAALTEGSSVQTQEPAPPVALQTDIPAAAASPTMAKPATPAVAQPVPTTVPARPEFRHSTGLERDVTDPFETVYTKVLRRRLEVGYRTVSHDLDVDGQIKGDRATFEGTYFGSINELKLYDDDIQNFYFQYAFIPYAGIGITWDEMDIATKDGPSPQESDGDVNIETDMFYLFVRYPIQLPNVELQITPFFEFGKADHSVGFSAEESWAARGNSLSLSDESGEYYAYGIEFTFHERFSAHVIWRRTEFTTTGQYVNEPNNNIVPVEMRLDHDSFGFGAKFTF